MKDPRLFFFLFFILTELSVCARALAEVSCVTTVTFKWHGVSETEKKMAAAKEVEEHWTTLTVKGATEEHAKKNLQPLLERNRAEAAKFCRQQHENLSGCMAARYLAMGSTYANLGFSAKKAMNDAIKVDCDKLQGKCLGAFSTNPECKEVEQAKGAEGGDAETTGEAKDEKDKKDAKEAPKK